MPLRSILIAAMSLLAGLTLAFSISLVTMGNYLRYVADDFERGTDSIRLVQEIELDLLSHDRATDPAARASLEANIRRGLREAMKFVDSPEEQSELARAARMVNEHLRNTVPVALDPPAAEDAPTLAPALDALRDLANENVIQARDVLKTATSWDRRADLLAIGLSVAVVVFVGALVGWLRFSAFQPIFAIERAMQRFAHGEGEARAPERGSTELQAIARSFNSLAEELSRRQRDQLAFLAGVAHDLRNPVSVLKMAGALVPADQPLPGEERVRQTLARVERQVIRLDRMIGDFLDAARIQSGVLELRVEPCDAREIAETVFELWSEVSPEHEIELSLPEQPLPIRCDAMRVEQVLNNLVSNAIKYSPQGGKVTLRLEREGESALFSVTDEGIGISPDDMERLFVPFRRGGATRGWISGAGLGLCVAKRITEAHGGRLDVESVVNHGSTFRVRLPRSKARVAPAAEAL